MQRRQPLRECRPPHQQTAAIGQRRRGFIQRERAIQRRQFCLYGRFLLLPAPGFFGGAARIQRKSRSKHTYQRVGIKDDVVDMEELACYLMDYLGRRYAPVLEERYKIDVQPEDSGYDLLEKAGRKRGFLMRGAQVDTQRMARVLLDEFRGGKLGRFTLETVEDAQ